jgi:MFS family permease
MAYSPPIAPRVPAIPATLRSAVGAVYLLEIMGLTNFYLLFAVVPRDAMRLTGEPRMGGLAAAALLVSTMIAEVSIARVVERLGYIRVLTLALFLLGLPSLALCGAHSSWEFLSINVLRGLGCAALFVVGAPLVSQFKPPEARAQAIGLYGVAVGLPSILGLPLGLWLAGNAGTTIVYLIAGASTLLACACLPFLSRALNSRPTRQASQPLQRQNYSRTAPCDRSACFWSPA